MDKREIFWNAWASQRQFDVMVSVQHGAKLPKGLEGLIKLTFGASLTKPIEDLKWHDGEGLQATLSFGGEKFECWLPIGAIAAITMDKWMVSWELKAIEAEKTAVNGSVTERAAKAGLRVVK